ncbi:MAG: carboxypeptidase regulatory-like domain-containing protein [Vicinamibacteria bacterium]
MLLVAAALAQAPRGASAAGPGAAIVGRVDVRLELPVPARRPEASALGAPPARALPDRRASVVYLEEAPRRAFEDAERPRARLDQRDEAFVPYVLAVQAGSVVEFPNSDRTFHNVFSLSRARSFDLGRYPRGQSKSVRFERAGIVRVFCDIHSHMSAWILVFAHRFFAVTDAQGRYRISGVPAGRYQLAVWTDGKLRESRGVSVPEAGEVTADFVVE